MKHSNTIRTHTRSSTQTGIRFSRPNRPRPSTEILGDSVWYLMVRILLWPSVNK
jgi:hypothetical protein